MAACCDHAVRKMPASLQEDGRQLWTDCKEPDDGSQLWTGCEEQEDGPQL